jgi:hypothetical protein
MKIRQKTIRETSSPPLEKTNLPVNTQCQKYTSVPLLAPTLHAMFENLNFPTSTSAAFIDFPSPIPQHKHTPLETEPQPSASP